MRRLALVGVVFVVLAGNAAAADFVARTGETVDVEVAPGSTHQGQQVADLLASFPHGRELGDVRVSVLPEMDASSRCLGAIACYFSNSQTIVIPDSVADYQWEQVLAHEYAHHIALHRSNAPWRAFDWGAKHWASAADVCAKGEAKLIFDRYRSDPGEAFAEAYRLMVAARVPTWTPFPVFVDEGLFSMDAEAQAAVLRDVQQPWTQPRTLSWSKRLRAGRPATITVRTPLDGDMSVRLLAGRGRVSVGGKSGRRVQRLVCGERSWRVRVNPAAAGVFRVSITVP